MNTSTAALRSRSTIPLGDGFSRGLLQRQATPGRRLAHHERLIGEILEGKVPLPRQPVARRRDDDELVAEERKDRKVGILERRTDDREVELVAENLLLDPRARPDLERDDNPRMQLLERPKGGRQKVDADRRARPDAEAAALDPTHLLERQRRFVEDVQGASRIRVQDRARLGELHALAEAVEERHADGLLELFDLV